MMPDNRNMSCCNDKDCEPSASKYENGSWYASRDGEWIKVPNHKIETERDSPDGQSHYCGIIQAADRNRRAAGLALSR